VVAAILNGVRQPRPDPDAYLANNRGDPKPSDGKYGQEHALSECELLRLGEPCYGDICVEYGPENRESTNDPNLDPCTSCFTVRPDE
jgi:hypothetical protein